MGPLAQSKGHDPLWMVDELVPGEAAVIDDVGVWTPLKNPSI
jgi:hypothetical protein